MKQIYERLAQAIAETGTWSWWAAKLPLAFQLEFDNTLVDTGTADYQGKVALAFYGLSSVSFLNRDLTPKEWAYQLNANKLDGFEMDIATFAFGGDALAKDMLESAQKVDVFYGASAQGTAFKTAQIQFGFWAAEVGVLVAAESVRLYSMAGEIQLANVKLLEAEVS